MYASRPGELVPIGEPFFKLDKIDFTREHEAISKLIVSKVR